MMKKRMVNVLTTSAMVAMMTAAMAMPAMAADTPLEVSSANTVTFKKKIVKPQGVNTPGTTVNFSVDPGEAGTDSNNKEVKAGIAGGVTFGTGAVFAANDATLDDTEIEADVTLNVDKTKFYAGGNLQHGIYRYVIKETDPAYDGMTPDYTGDYTMDLYVSEEDGDAKFTYTLYNTEGVKVDTVVNNYDAKGLTVTKEVAGNQGDKVNKAFRFSITVEGQPGDKFNVSGDADYNVVYETTTALDGTTVETGVATITTSLKHDQSINVLGLSPEDTFNVVELDANADEYVTTYKLDTNVAVENAPGVVTEGSDNHTVLVTNKKDVTTPTGIALATAPYALMVALAGIFGFSFFRKKREEI